MTNEERFKQYVESICEPIFLKAIKEWEDENDIIMVDYNKWQ